MGILKDIWNKIFGKSKKQEHFERGTSIRPAMTVVHKKEQSSSDIFSEPIFNSSNHDNPDLHKSTIVDKSYVILDIEPKTVPTDGLINENNVIVHTKKKNAIVGLKTKIKIGEYFKEFGSLDELTCKQKFKIKSLRNVVSELRKDGLKFKTERIVFHDEWAKSIETVNYKLIK